MSVVDQSVTSPTEMKGEVEVSLIDALHHVMARLLGMEFKTRQYNMLVPRQC